MSGDGFGSPPWDPADPVPERGDTQAIPGLGAVPGTGKRTARPGTGQRFWSDGTVTGNTGPGTTVPGNRVPGNPGPGDSARADGPGGGAGPRQLWSDGTVTGNRVPGNPGPGNRVPGNRVPGNRVPGNTVPGNTGPGDGARADGPGGGAGPRQLPGADVNEDSDAADASNGNDVKDGTGKKRRSFWREVPVLIVVALVLALVIKSFAIQAFYIPSASMQNTLEIGDRVLINKVVYHLRPIHRGDIIVFDGTGSWDFDNPPASPSIFSKAISELSGLVGVSQDPSIYIKRVIGLPGDHVACCNTAGQITVDGVPLSESSYLYPGNVPSTQKFAITVPPGRLWVMGDHRVVSYDSRGHMGDPGGGTIPESGVLGRAFVIIWPPSRWGSLNIPATFEQPQLNAPAAAGTNAAAADSAAALAAAMDNGTPIRPATSPLPLALGVIGAVPLTWLQRKARHRLRSLAGLLQMR